MNEYKFNTIKSDNHLGDYETDNDIKVYEYKKNNQIYKTIKFNNLNNKKELIDTISKELIFLIKILNIKKNIHILVVGLGNDNHTADSIGPKTLKHLNVNSHYRNIGFKNNKITISALEPGTLAETGILTSRIIESVTEEIKPDLVILIDSFISDNIKCLNKIIEINNVGIETGIGIHEISSKINKDTLNVPVIVIGIVSAIELNLKNSNIPYLLTSKDIDIFVYNIAKIVSKSINNVANLL